MIHVREGQVRKIHAHKRAVLAVFDPRRKMLLNNKSGGARSQRLLIAAEKRRRSRLRYGVDDIQRRWTRLKTPDAEHKTLTIDHRYHAVRGFAGNQEIIRARECLGH